MPIVSIIIPSYNSAMHLPEMLESIFQQIYQDFEIIVVDDGSTDDTREVLMEYRDRITYIHQKNRGSYNARNTGIRASNSPYIAFLDADDLWLPNKLERQFELMNSNPRLGLVFSDAEYFGGDGCMKDTYWKQRGCYDAMVAESAMIQKPFSKLMETNFIMPSTVLLKKDCFSRAGLFDDSLRHVGDKDMWLRIALHDPIACVPVPLVMRYVHEYSPEQTETIQQSIIYVVLKMQRDHPEQIQLEKVNVRRILGPLYYSLGRIQFDRDRFDEARKSFNHSLRNRPSLKASLFFFISLLGARFIDFLRAGKRGFLKLIDSRHAR